MIWAVFRIELLRAIRRGRGHFLRWTYVLFLLAQVVRLLILWRGGRTESPEFFAFLGSFLLQHCVLLALLIPAVVCGAITEEKTRGTLQHLLIASADPAAIIAGKLFFHLFQLGLWLLTGLPVFVLFATLARDVSVLVTMLTASLALMLAIAGLSLLCSVWCRSTRAALLGAYLIMGAVVLAAPPLAATFWWIDWMNPAHLLPLHDRLLRWPSLLEFVLPWAYFGYFFSLVSAARLRSAYLRQLQAVDRGPGSWRTPPSRRVRGNPITWRDRQTSSIAPGWIRPIPRALGVLAAMLAVVVALPLMTMGPPDMADKSWGLFAMGQWAALLIRLSPLAGDAFFREGLAALLILTFVVAIRASASITSEKEKETWLALMVTTLSTRDIVAGKYHGVLAACLPYVLGHAVVTISIGLAFGIWPAVLAVIGTLLMLLVVVVGSAIGLWCSSRTASSWRSLAMTITIFYLGMVPVLVLWASMILTEASSFGQAPNRPFWMIGSPSVAPWAVFIGIAVCMWFVTRGLLTSVHARISRKDRWEMGIEPAQRVAKDASDHEEDPWVKEVEAWKPPTTADSRLALPVCENLFAVTSREVKRAVLAAGRQDEENAVRHFLAAAHMFVVLSEEYADNALFDLALRSKENAICCFWRAGHERQARLLFEELKQDNPIFAGDIDSIVLDLQQNHSGWGPY